MLLCFQIRMKQSVSFIMLGQKKNVLKLWLTALSDTVYCSLYVKYIMTYFCLGVDTVTILFFDWICVHNIPVYELQMTVSSSCSCPLVCKLHVLSSKSNNKVVPNNVSKYRTADVSPFSYKKTSKRGEVVYFLSELQANVRVDTFWVATFNLCKYSLMCKSSEDSSLQTAFTELQPEIKFVNQTNDFCASERVLLECRYCLLAKISVENKYGAVMIRLFLTWVVPDILYFSPVYLADSFAFCVSSHQSENAHCL